MTTDLFIGIALWALSTLTIAGGSWRIACSIEVVRHKRLLAAYVVATAVIIVSAEMLALASLLNSRVAWLAASFCFGAMALVRTPLEGAQTLSADLKRWPVRAVGVAYAGLFLVAVLLPVNNYDTMTYHLARVGYYLQQGNFDFFETNDVHQVSLQINAEILELWTVAFLRRDWLAPLVQFSAALAGALAVFGIMSRLRMPRLLGVLAALLFLGYPQVATQATTPKNDLFSAVVGVIGVFFILEFKHSGRREHAALAGASIGIAAGSKATIWLLLPGLGFLLLHSAMRQGRLSRVRLATMGVAMLMGAAVFVSPHLIRTQLATGYPLMREVKLTVDAVSPQSITANGLRFGFDMIGAADLPDPAHRRVVDAKRQAESWLRFSPDVLHAPGSTFGDSRFTFSGGHLTEEFAWFGVSGLLIFCCMWITLIWSLRRRRAAWLAYAAVPIAFLAGVLLLLRWQPWSGRFITTAMMLAIPLGLKGVALAVSRQRRIVRRLAWAVLCALAISGSFVALLQNRNKPLMPVERMRTVWRLSREEQRCRWVPGNVALVRFLNSIPPSRIGVFSAGTNWDRLLFGEDFRHTVRRYRLKPDLAAVFEKDQCDIFVLGFEAESPPGVNVIRLNETWEILTTQRWHSNVSGAGNSSQSTEDRQ